MTGPDPISTADLCDRLGPQAVVAPPIFRDYGGRLAFAGRVMTVRVHDDNALVRLALATPGEGRVLVVDGGGSLRCALLGDKLAGLGVAHAWGGVIVHGCVRDSAALRALPIGVKALATHPARSRREGTGELNVPLTIAGVRISPDAYITADADGIVITAEPPTIENL